MIEVWEIHLSCALHHHLVCLLIDESYTKICIFQNLNTWVQTCWLSLMMERAFKMNCSVKVLDFMLLWSMQRLEQFLEACAERHRHHLSMLLWSMKGLVGHSLWSSSCRCVCQWRCNRGWRGCSHPCIVVKACTPIRWWGTGSGHVVVGVFFDGDATEDGEGVLIPS